MSGGRFDCVCVFARCVAHPYRLYSTIRLRLRVCACDAPHPHTEPRYVYGRQANRTKRITHPTSVTIVTAFPRVLGGVPIGQCLWPGRKARVAVHKIQRIPVRVDDVVPGVVVVVGPVRPTKDDNNNGYEGRACLIADERRLLRLPSLVARDCEL